MSDQSRLIGKFLFHNPIIFYAWMYSEKDLPVFDLLQDSLRDQQAYFLMWIPWSKESHYSNYKGPSENILKWLEPRKIRWPNHAYIYMCNTHVESLQLAREGIPAFLFNQNALIDPSCYYPTYCKKNYLSIYNAQFVPFKRHELLAESSSMLFIGHSIDSEYFTNVVSPLIEGGRARVGNEIVVQDGSMRLVHVNVNDHINLARVGLALSSTEGAMHAAVEYLLAGIPVVTTHNVGGRDYLMDGRYCIHVQDSPYVISQAIEALASMDFSPELIREQTISKQKTEISRFKDFLANLIASRRRISPLELEALWESVYYNKLHHSMTVDEHLSELSMLEAKFD